MAYPFRFLFVLGVFSSFIPSLSASDSLEKLAKKLAKGVSKIESKRVAVLAFPYHDGRISSGSSMISERLTTDLVGKKGIQIIERRLIQKLLEEKKLSETGAIDATTAKTIGSVLGADALVTGTLIDLNNNETEINARLIQAQSGEIISAGKSSITRTWTDSPRFPKAPLSENQLKFNKPTAKPKTAFESDPELNQKDEEEMEVASLKKQKTGPSLRLSNEDFPEGRRRYHAVENDSYRPSSSFKEDKYREGMLDEEYDAGYEEGYQEGQKYAEKTRRSEQRSGTSSQNTQNYERSTLAQDRIDNFKKQMYYHTRP